jgi:short-subunit dehydrogenase
MEPQAVVTAALAALDRRRSVVIPGPGNRLTDSLPRLLGRQAMARMTERVMRPKPANR